MNRLRVVNASSEMLDSERYDVLLAALGFESRAIAVSSRLADKSRNRFAFGFDHNQVLSYQKNAAWFRTAGFDARESLDADAFECIVGETLDDQEPSSLLRVAVDVSCFDRHRLAIIVDALWALATHRDLCVDFHYCIAAFQPPTSTTGRNVVAGPVHRSFAGRFVDPGRPLAMVAGLGYELGKVVGAAEYLQASRVIALFPESPVREYEQEVSKANQLLLDDLPSADVVRYAVDDCRKTVATLDSIVRGLRDNHNVVMLPGGPKIFVLASLVVQRIHRQVSVWRVSSGASIAARDVASSGHFVTARLAIGPGFFAS